MRGVPETRITPTFFHHGPGANTAATKTIAADSLQTHVLDWIVYSFDTATNKVTTLTVTINAVTVFQVEIEAGFSGVGEPIYFPGGMYGSVNQAMVVTLLADDGGAKGKLNIRYH